MSQFHAKFVLFDQSTNQYFVSDKDCDLILGDLKHAKKFSNIPRNMDVCDDARISYSKPFVPYLLDERGNVIDIEWPDMHEYNQFVFFDSMKDALGDDLYDKWADLAKRLSNGEIIPPEFNFIKNRETYYERNRYKIPEITPRQLARYNRLKSVDVDNMTETDFQFWKKTNGRLRRGELTMPGQVDSDVTV